MTSVPECTFCPVPAHEIGHSLCISLMEKAVYEAVFWWVCFVCKLSFQDKHYRTNRCSGCSVKCYPKAVIHHIENMTKLVARFCLEGLHQALAIFFFCMKTVITRSSLFSLGQDLELAKMRTYEQWIVWGKLQGWTESWVVLAGRTGRASSLVFSIYFTSCKRSAMGFWSVATKVSSRGLPFV